MAGERSLLPRKPVPIPSVPCRPKDVSGKGDGVCTDEVHRSLRGGKVRDRRGGEGEDPGARAVPHPEDERRPAN